MSELKKSEFKTQDKYEFSSIYQRLKSSKESFTVFFYNDISFSMPLLFGHIVEKINHQGNQLLTTV